MRGTVDNLTATSRLERQLARTGSCALTARVFDGRPRLRSGFRRCRAGDAVAGGGQKFSGSAIACRMTRRYPGRHCGFGEGRGGSARTICTPGCCPAMAGSGADGNGHATRRGRGLFGELHAPGVDLALME